MRFTITWRDCLRWLRLVESGKVAVWFLSVCLSRAGILASKRVEGSSRFWTKRLSSTYSAVCY